MPAVNDVGEPCAREPHARFDGRELETERHGQGHRSGTTRRETAGTKASGPTATPTATAPAPDPTQPWPIRVVLISSDSDPANVAAALRAGAAGFVPKDELSSAALRDCIERG